ncbi:mitochondrial import inner membrane translocase subunit TIM14 [Hyalella azteca]|uniref:Mitochondrial import inner membrane translocase subunit TIM14 n=1 Tax=Hyalella azteca TaxID=294128 RepID=A0A8B7PN88_HYAAZ|nr:mitochondrial import inner membrane translocase subunit TIM14 [Hyalella azteca]
MAGTLIVAGLGMAAVGFGARFMLRTIPNLGQKMANAATSMPRLDGEMFASSKYYKGGFEPKMTKREASLILGVSPTAPPAKVKVAYKRLMLTNHPDRGGSPYLSSKISEAKDMLDK